MEEWRSEPADSLNSAAQSVSCAPWQAWPPAAAWHAEPATASSAAAWRAEPADIPVLNIYCILCV